MYTQQNETYFDIMEKVESDLKSWLQTKEAKEKHSMIVEAEKVPVTAEDTFNVMSGSLIKRYGHATFDYKLDRYQEELEQLKITAREKVDAFNNYTKELEADERYTETGKVELYRSERKKVEQELKEIGEAQHQLTIEIQSINVEKAKNAWKRLEETMTTDSLSPSDYQYIDMMLSRNDSDEARKALAEKYHYHLVVLDILNADRKWGEKSIHHPLSALSTREVNHLRNGDVMMPELYASSYIHDLLRNLHGKIVHKGDFNGIQEGSLV